VRDSWVEKESSGAGRAAAVVWTAGLTVVLPTIPGVLMEGFLLGQPRGRVRVVGEIRGP